VGSTEQDALECAKQASLVGEFYVFDLDAEAGGDAGNNNAIVDELLDMVPCRLGGGFTSNDRVYDWLDKGATQVTVNYAESNMGFLDGVPRDRITIAVKLDGAGGSDPTLVGGKKISEAMEEISYYARRILVEFQGSPKTLDRCFEDQ
jgi:phosphoribosylformimino-5-aminoimidazole carboxamide ribonucleotide (ProFAR) isomerase